MNLVWDPRARENLYQIARYIQSKFGSKAKKNFIKSVRETESLLKNSPYLGQIDSLFADRTFTYRSIIINGLSKLVYFVANETIYIAAFWDTRSEPNKQAENK